MGFSSEEPYGSVMIRDRAFTGPFTPALQHTIIGDSYSELPIAPARRSGCCSTSAWKFDAEEVGLGPTRVRPCRYQFCMLPTRAVPYEKTLQRTSFPTDMNKNIFSMNDKVITISPTIHIEPSNRFGYRAMFLYNSNNTTKITTSWTTFLP